MAAGMQDVEVRFTVSPEESLPVGVLAIQGHRLFFEYHSFWLQRNLELSPFILPAKAGLVEHQQRTFGPLFGLFDDSLPDGWGLLLMDRHFRSLGREPSTLSPLDRLLYLGRSTMGALTYYPHEARTSETDLLDLHDLAAHSQQIFAGDEAEILPLLLRTGGSPGGARPKVLVGWNGQDRRIIAGDDDLPPGFEHWLVKFSAEEDSRDAGPVEYAYALMACAAGIAMPETRLFTTEQGESFFGIKRFDRSPDNRRYHIHTFGNLIQANFRIPSCDYADLFKVTTLLTRNHEDLLRAFRLMLFNILTHNRDDHVKNFSFILDDRTGKWSLAPAYDLTFANGPGGEHSMTVAGEGRAPGYRQVAELAGQYSVAEKELEMMLDEVGAAVERWPEFAQVAGVRRVVSARISRRLASIRFGHKG
ncbi:type II toxin-antitoxin system HipA family toxin [Candidatus Electrothrix sp.]|uniref:type II toxin-antitoxin system HipA family toxin n=1 Tax=Candidatus Electrothrix sp. TaxID=2170559 RepID=UPI004055D143